MGYSLEFKELTNSDTQHTFEIKDISDKLAPGKSTNEVTIDYDFHCDGFGVKGYIKTEDGKLMCIMDDDTEMNFLDVLIKFKPKETWE